MSDAAISERKVAANDIQDQTEQESASIATGGQACQFLTNLSSIAWWNSAHCMPDAISFMAPPQAQVCFDRGDL
jgi:hypothetical protein